MANTTSTIRVLNVLKPQNKKIESKATTSASDSYSFSSTPVTTKHVKSKRDKKVGMVKTMRRLSCNNNTTVNTTGRNDYYSAMMMMTETTITTDTASPNHKRPSSRRSNTERGSAEASKEEILKLLEEDLMLRNHVDKSDNVRPDQDQDSKEVVRSPERKALWKEANDFCRKERMLVASRNKDDKEIYQLLTEDLFSGDPETLSHALHKISDFCNSKVVKSEIRASKNGKYIVDHDGVGVMVQVMKANQDYRTILAVGARALGNLMYSYDGAREKVHRLGGSQTILSAMKAYPTDTLVQRNGVGFFQNVIADDDECKRFFALELEGIPTIVSAMINHPNIPDLQRYGVRTLCFLSEQEAYVNLVEKKGGLVAVATSLRLHRDDPSIVKHAKKVIKAMSDYLQNE